jgi:hypothetical protein
VPTDPVSLALLAAGILSAVWALLHGAGSPRNDPPCTEMTAADHEQCAADLLEQARREWGTKVPTMLAQRAQAHAQLAASLRIADQTAHNETTTCS